MIYCTVYKYHIKGYLVLFPYIFGDVVFVASCTWLGV